MLIHWAYDAGSVFLVQLEPTYLYLWPAAFFSAAAGIVYAQWRFITSKAPGGSVDVPGHV